MTACHALHTRWKRSTDLILRMNFTFDENRNFVDFPYIEEMGSFNKTWNVSTNSSVQGGVPFPFFELVLDPVIARLNNDTFGDTHTGETPGTDVVCRDYWYLANNSFSMVPSDGFYFRGGRPAFRWLTDRPGNQTAEPTCLVLLDANFGSSTLEDAQGSARLGWQKYKPHAHTLWCSTNRTQIGPGWLPLTMHTGLSLLRQYRPEAFYNITNNTRIVN